MCAYEKQFFELEKKFRKFALLAKLNETKVRNSITI